MVKVDQIRFLLGLFIQIHSEDIYKSFSLLIQNCVEEGELEMSIAFIWLQLTLEKLDLRVQQLLSSDPFIIFVIYINKLLVSDKQVVIGSRKVYVFNRLLGYPVLQADDIGILLLVQMLLITVGLLILKKFVLLLV